MKKDLERQSKKKEKKPRNKQPKKPKNVVSQEDTLKETIEKPISSEELKELNKLIEQSIIENELDLGNPYEIKCYDNDGNFTGIETPSNKDGLERETWVSLETDLPKNDSNIDLEGLIKSYGSEDIDPEGNFRPNWKNKPTLENRVKMSKVKKELKEKIGNPTILEQELKPKKRGKKQINKSLDKIE